MVETLPNSRKLHRIKTIPSGKKIKPLSDEEKQRRKILDCRGAPKQPKVDLYRTDICEVVHFVLFDSKSKCDICDAENKSDKILLLRNVRTGVEFHAARNCLANHFGEDIEEYRRESQQLRSLLEGTIKLFREDDFHFETLEDALEIAITNFDRLVAFPCTAVRQAKDELERIQQLPSEATRGMSDMVLRDIQSLIALQQDYLKDARLFEARWHALLSHPVRNSREWRFSDIALHTVLKRRDSLSLSDASTLLEMLEIAGRYRHELRNAINPWEFPSREAYHQGLLHYYQEKLFAYREKNPRFHYKKDTERLGTLLARARERKRPVFFNIFAAPYSTSVLKSFQVPNLDTFSGSAGEVLFAEAIRREDIGGKHKTEKVDMRGACLYFPDLWSETYSYWFEYGGVKGKHRLSSINPVLK